MAVKIKTLWGSDKFNKLKSNAKLLYLYLLTNPQLNKLGVITLNKTKFCTDLSFYIEDLRDATERLVTHKYIEVKKFDDRVYFIVKRIFSPNIKSQAVILELQDILSEYPDELVRYLESIGIVLERRITIFKVPTVEEVAEYSMSLGYNVNAKYFIEYYNNSSLDRKDGKWQDGRGKIIHDWKAKLRRVWCKDENKIKSIKGAPKGYETFHIIVDGKVIYPDSWKGGKPFSKSLAIDIKLKEAYDK